jgi:hypothetical protein
MRGQCPRNSWLCSSSVRRPASLILTRVTPNRASTGDHALGDLEHIQLEGHAVWQARQFNSQ